MLQENTRRKWVTRLFHDHTLDLQIIALKNQGRRILPRHTK